MTFLLAFARAQAQPVIDSTIPANGATGVSTTAAVVFTFSEAMDISNTTAIFYDESTFSLLTTSSNWSDGNTVLTCTPGPPFPTSAEILWAVEGQDPDGNPLGGIPSGTFMTGTGGGGGGGTAGTNQYTAFGVGLGIAFIQASSAAPTLQSLIAPYSFIAEVALSSNQSAVSATVELPSTSVSNMSQVAPGQYIMPASDTDQAALDNTFGNGNYIFTVVSASSNDEVTVNLPATVVQPGAPQISNYSAAQSVNPAQAFPLTWDAFTGGTAADVISVTIGSAFATAPVGTSNALPGTATSLEIPANTLRPGSNYDCFIGFYHINLGNHTSAGYTTAAYRFSSTEFNLSTTSGAMMPVVLTNASWNGHAFNFNVSSAIGQSVIVEYNTGGGPFSNLWQTLLAATNATGVLQVTDSAHTASPSVFYRARIGP